jgi:hypothetical protein
MYVIENIWLAFPVGYQQKPIYRRWRIPRPSIHGMFFQILGTLVRIPIGKLENQQGE